MSILPVIVLTLLAILLCEPSVVICQVKVQEIASPVRITEDPTIRGEHIQLAGSLPKAPPEHKGEGSYALHGKTRWLNPKPFTLKPGKSKEIQISAEEPMIALVRAIWRGSESAPKVVLLKDKAPLASGKPYHVLSTEGEVTARTEIYAPGSVTIFISNVGVTGEEIELVAGSLPLSR